MTAYHRPWEGWWYLDTTNYAVWIDTPTSTGPFYANDGAGNEIVARYGDLVQGSTPHWADGITGTINHIDIGIGGPSSTTPAGMGITAMAWSYSCVEPVNSVGFSRPFGSVPETMMLAHELGHAYGYAHFESWLSTLNYIQSNSIGCELGTSSGVADSMWMTPSAQGQQCHDIVYGLADGVDLAVGAAIANGWSGGNILARTPGSTDIIPIPSSVEFYIEPNPLRFTTYSMRDSVSGYVSIRLHLSLDRILGAGDIPLSTLTTSAGWQGGDTVTRQMTPAFVPATALPMLNTTYFLLVQVDATSVVGETRETNNVTDTGYRYRRVP